MNPKRNKKLDLRILNQLIRMLRCLGISAAEPWKIRADHRILYLKRRSQDAE